MSVILIDLGNSALKWCSLDSPESPSTFIHKSSGLLEETLKEEWLNLNLKKAYGCSVGSDWLAHSTSSFFKSHDVDFQWFKAEEKFTGEFELVNRYEHPHLLGADRWFAVIGSVALHPNQPLLVCHLGTASTVDSVIPVADGKYEFLGGRIAPGPAMMREGLARGTSHLPRAFGQTMYFPTNTIAAITTGIVDSQLGLIERAVKRMEGMGMKPQILLAGGAAKMIAPYIVKEHDQVDIRHNLVLHGLATKVKSVLRQ